MPTFHSIVIIIYKKRKFQEYTIHQRNMKPEHVSLDLELRGSIYLNSFAQIDFEFAPDAHTILLALVFRSTLTIDTMERRYLVRLDGSENNKSHREYGHFKVQAEEEGEGEEDRERL
jgi:hypothetical protein